MIYLLRHAKAGDRRSWEGDDRLRPLSKRGRRQADGLLSVLDGLPVDRILSSPYVRCLETVVPLASARGLAVDPVDDLAEGASLVAALGVVAKLAPAHVVLCSHGDVIPMLLAHFKERGVAIDEQPPTPKASTWVLETDEVGEVVAARYLRPPAD